MPIYDIKVQCQICFNVSIKQIIRKSQIKINDIVIIDCNYCKHERRQIILAIV